MIIEFIGIPGSGKTHIANELRKFIELRTSDFQVIDSAQILKEIKGERKGNRALILLPRVCNVTFASVVLKIMVGKSPFSGKKLLIKILLRRILMYQKVQEKKINDQNLPLFIFDEGLLHYAIAFFRNSGVYPQFVDIQKFLNQMKRIVDYSSADIMWVFVDPGDTEETYRRITQRTSGWPGTIGGLTDDGKRKYIVESYRRYNAIKEYATSMSNSPVIDNSIFKNSYIENFESILENVQKMHS